MADASISFMYVMRNEDSQLSGVVSPEPKGGYARFGVNSLAHPEAIDAGFYQMSKDAALKYAEMIFKVGYWTPVQGDSINNQQFANKLVDLSFDMSPTAAIKIAQRAVNFLNIPLFRLDVDGEMGPKTLKEINHMEIEQLLMEFKDYATQYYRDIVRAHPSDSKYLDGWLARLDK